MVCTRLNANWYEFSRFHERIGDLEMTVKRTSVAALTVMSALTLAVGVALAEDKSATTQAVTKKIAAFDAMTGNVRIQARLTFGGDLVIPPSKEAKPESVIGEKPVNLMVESLFDGSLRFQPQREGTEAQMDVVMPALSRRLGEKEPVMKGKDMTPLYWVPGAEVMVGPGNFLLIPTPGRF
jgi:hypothetical protein